jgi:hypothetical protein
VGWLRWLPSVVVLLPWLLGPAMPSNAARLRDLSGASSFRLLDWETVNLGERAARLWRGLTGAAGQTPEDARTLQAFFSRARSQSDDRPAVEAALERTVSQAYTRAGVTRSEPVATPGLFPPVLVALTQPPNVLVISPRTQLRVLESVVLNAMDVAAQERLEASADSTGVVSLVAPIGGLATYPAMVLEEDAPDRLLASVAHEWLHQYLIFYPLGVHYWDSQETREINETTADLVGQEVGSGLARELDLRPSPRPAAQTRGAFDFRAFMRETRFEVERLLSVSQVDAAEAYMRRRRDELEQHGYHLRKLNQAYFALYGSYTEGFAASPTNPIPDLLHRLREQSGSLAEFIFRVRSITTVAELRAAVSPLAANSMGSPGART